MKRVEGMEIKQDSRLVDVRIISLLEEHVAEMKSITPPESKHALDLDGLRVPEISFWAVWDADNVAGCGAIRELDQNHVELKSMRTASAYQGRGVASRLLRHIVARCRERGYQRISLETGAMDFFIPARRLYAKFGFMECSPFADYRDDANSVFMTIKLS
jgi:putative acetyltransferase